MIEWATNDPHAWILAAICLPVAMLLVLCAVGEIFNRVFKDKVSDLDRFINDQEAGR